MSFGCVLNDGVSDNNFAFFRLVKAMYRQVFMLLLFGYIQRGIERD